MNERLQRLYEENPAEFRRVMAEALKRTVIPHAGQVPVLESKARFKVMNCGRRFGKTVLAAKIMTTKARKSNQMLWWVAPTYRIVKRGYVEVLKQLPAGSLAKNAPPATNFDAGRAVILEFKNGTTMEFYSAERPEGMLGAAVDFAVLDEAARMKADVWQETVSPTLIDHLGGCLIISTPRGRNWFYDVWLKGQPAGDPEYESWTFITQDNPTLPPGEADRMAATMPKSKADQEIFAKWLAAGSSVFLLGDNAKQSSAIQSNGLVEDGIEAVKGHHVFLGVDLARTNDWTVLYGERDDGYNVFFERMQDVAWAEQRRRIRRAVGTLRRAGATGVTLMIDEGNGQTTTVEDLQDGGYDAIGINFTTNKAPMVRLLANDLERGAARVLDDPQYGVLEFENYAMDVTPTGRYTYAAPEGQHDDVVSAKMLAHWGVVNEGTGSVTVIDPDGPADQRPTPTNGPFEDTDPWGEQEDFEGDSWDDLIDDDPNYEDPQRAAEAVGLVAIDLTRPLSPQELLLRDDVWG